MKHLFTLFFLLALSRFAHTQQLPLFTQYRDYAGIINPASVPFDYLWNEKTLSFGASYRKQWVTDQDGPSTQVLRADYVNERSNVIPIFGGYLMNDKAARVGFLGAYGRIGMLFSDKPSERGISVGLNAGLVRYALDLSNARVRNTNDPNLFNEKSKLFPDVGIGTFMYTTLGNENLLYGGLSVPQVIGLNLKYKTEAGGDVDIRRKQHFYATAGYKMALRDEYSFLDFSLWAKFIAPVAPHFDFNLRYQMNDMFYMGTGLGTSGFAHLEGGFMLGADEERMFRIGFAADFPFSPTAAYYGNSYECNVAYSIDR
jgi:type IX secretion system PorP/SprF family membrane protein